MQPLLTPTQADELVKKLRLDMKFKSDKWLKEFRKLAAGPPTTVCVLLVRKSDGKVLTVRPNDSDQWWDVGGKLLAGENADTGATRIALREVGIDLDDDSCEYRGDEHSPWAKATIQVYRIDGDPAITPGGSIDKYAWRSVSELKAVQGQKYTAWDDGARAHFRLDQSLKHARDVIATPW
eukprot:COSAG02_NODE_332_length_24474_cov_23.190949_20_plen_180_part_00